MDRGIQLLCCGTSAEVVVLSFELEVGVCGVWIWFVPVRNRSGVKNAGGVCFCVCVCGGGGVVCVFVCLFVCV